MQEGYFKLYNPLDNEEQQQANLALSNLIFATNEDGTPVDGCSLALVERFDNDYQKVFIRTTDEVWATAGKYPVLELLEMKLTCSQCGKEWWGLPSESGLCAECDGARPEEVEE